MGCACKNKNRTRWEVVTDGGSGKVVFTGANEATVRAVSRRYKDSIVREKPKN